MKQTVIIGAGSWGTALAALWAKDGRPISTVIGCANENYAIELQRFLGSEHFRIYTSDDVVSIELGGALKNVFAIAAGVSDGLSLGDNSKAALVTRAMAE